MITDDFLEDLERELVLVHRRRRSGRGAMPRVAARVTGALAVVAASVWVISTLAGSSPAERPAAVTGKRGASPPGDERARAFTMRTGELLGLRVADPDGGPPWGLRLGTTYTGLQCLQVGRVVDGQLGYLGVAGAAQDDGRFHPLPAQKPSVDCGTPDRVGHAFVATRYFGMRRSGLDTGCLPASDVQLPPGVKTLTPLPSRQICADADVRFVSFGLLGPDARSITYPDSDGKTVQQTVGAGGAYLVVRRPLAGEDVGAESSPGALPTGNAFTEARYADGSTCRPRVGTTSAHPECPARGYAAPDTPLPTEKQLATTATARVAHARVDGLSVLQVTVTFRARLPTGDGSFYAIIVHSRGCRAAGTTAVMRNVRAGETVTAHALLERSGPRPGCHGPALGRVVYQPPPDAPYVGGPYTGDPRAQVTAARFRARIPRS